MRKILFLTVLTLMAVCIIPDAFGQGVVSRPNKQTPTKPTPAKPKLTVNGNSESLFIDFSDTGETKQLTISSNQGTPKVPSTPTWISITSISSKAIYVKCDPNPTSFSRDGSFEVKAGKLSVTVDVSQPAGRPLITNVDFGNQGSNNTTINDFGTKMYASDIRYLTPRITYNGPGSRQNITLYVKIFNSDGKLMEGNNSPGGYTTKWDVTFEPGNNKKLTLPGWGNNSESHYKAGEIKLEIYCDGINIYNASVNLDNKYYGSINGHEWVDLGLPSGLKWATCNVGASSPSDFGYYFAWGETNTKSDYSIDNCRTWLRTLGDIRGNVGYDAARAYWDGSWRLPTKTEYEELVNCCTWTFMTVGNHNGYKVIGPNGNFIFLPAAGGRTGTSLYNVGEYGYYWTSTPYESYTQSAYELCFNSGAHKVGWCSRYYGQSVRPVSE